METLQAMVSAPASGAIAQMRDPETTRSAFIPANSRVRAILAHDDLPEGRATEHRPSSNAVAQSLSHSLPNSQDSNHSFSSYASSAIPRFQASSSNLSQNTEVSIPSSVASFERSGQSEGQKDMARTGQTSQVSSADWRPAPAGFPIAPHIDTNVEDVALRNGQSNDTSPTSLTSPASVGGTKRTSSGMMKRPGSSHGIPSNNHASHSRTNSAQSNGSRTGGLAADLKTKLTYAMLKVNNGWQKNNIDQIEQLASQKASPTSATFSESISRRAYASPHFAASNAVRRISGDSSDSDSYLASPNVSASTPINGSITRFATKTSSSPQRNSWSSRSFPQNPYAKSAAASGVIAAHSNLAAATSNPVLAPPPDIGPSSRNRRVEMSSYRPPSLPGSHRKQPSGSSAPRTPTQNPRATLIRTPTEQARAERDALDTLMFMSSPGNSAQYAHTSQGSRGQPSPLGIDVKRNVVLEGVRSVRTPGQRADKAYSTSSGSTGASPGGRARSHGPIRRPQGDVARILDEMEDEDSDKEEGTAPAAVRA